MKIPLELKCGVIMFIITFLILSLVSASGAGFFFDLQFHFVLALINGTMAYILVVFKNEREQQEKEDREELKKEIIEELTSQTVKTQKDVQK